MQWSDAQLQGACNMPSMHFFEEEEKKKKIAVLSRLHSWAGLEPQPNLPPTPLPSAPSAHYPLKRVLVLTS